MQETSDLPPSINDLYAEMDSLINHGDPYGNRETRGRLYGLSVEIEEAGDAEVAREIREELSATKDRAEVTMIEVESGDPSTATFISAERHAENLAAANFGPADEATDDALVDPIDNYIAESKAIRDTAVGIDMTHGLYDPADTEGLILDEVQGPARALLDAAWERDDINTKGLDDALLGYAPALPAPDFSVFSLYNSTLADEVTEQFVEANTPTLLAVPGETNRARRRRLEAKRIEGLKAESLARHIEAYQAAAGDD